MRVARLRSYGHGLRANNHLLQAQAAPPQRPALALVELVLLPRWAVDPARRPGRPLEAGRGPCVKKR